ncbi:uncharacterized protein LOC113122843 [Mastacembelus armatus]|uniref:Uncharacterized LOC113122843 n=1 Tax=Mastacembelus armatus TaxID=205130 RepID=A0A3Q3N2K3_9TELE|nr:uncharacterized protein LOC113122843 [Mastacembelus armatus]
MEASCVQEVSSHTATLLSSLNLQRERAQFCDCVVRQSQSPGELYPAHRCVLAASSPVLASILSSASALVELQAPCLSGSVLALLLDYIYTGTLPYAHSLQQYYSLLSAASYLQMDELQEALWAWQQNDADKTNSSNGTDTQPYRDNINTHSKTSTWSTDGFRRLESSASYLKRKDPSIVEISDETSMHSASKGPCIKEAETDTCGTSNTNGNCCSRIDSSAISTESWVNTDNCRQVTHLSTQNLIHNIPSTTEVHGVSRMDKEVQKDLFHSASTVKAETWQKNREGGLTRIVEDKKSSSSSPSLSPHPCCGAVPVICHSSTAVMHQLAEVPAMPVFLPVSQALVNAKALVSQSANTENERMLEGITTKHKHQHGGETLNYRSNKDTGTQSCAVQDLCYKSNTDQFDMLKQDDSRSDPHDLIKPDDTSKGLSDIPDHKNHKSHRDSFQNKNHRKYVKDDLVPQNKVCSKLIRGLTFETDFDDFPSKHQQMDCSDCHSILLSAATEQHSQDPRSILPLPVGDSDTGSNSHCEALCPRDEAVEEHSFSSKQGHDCNLYRPKPIRYPTLDLAETSKRDTSSNRYQQDSGNKGTAMGGRRHSADVCLLVPNMPESNLDNITDGLSNIEHHRDIETTEPHLTFTFPVDSKISDPMFSDVGHSYHGHLHYHCLPQENIHLSHGYSDHKHSHTSYLGQTDQSSDDDEGGPGHSPLSQHFSTGTTDQVLLLDISARPAELLVSYNHSSEQEEKGVIVNKKDTFESRIRNNDTEQRNEATSGAGAGKRNSTAKTEFMAESFDKDQNKSENAEEGKSAGGDQSRSIADIINNTGVVEVSNNENQTSILTACSHLSVPDSVQASMSSTLSVCIPSTLSAGMSTNISAHLSTPVHQSFQCSLCDRSFSQRGSLNRHVRSHLGVRPFPCPHCPMTFSRQYRVMEHMRVHQRCTLGNDFHKPPVSSV